FLEGGNVLQVVNLNSGVATLNISTLAVGSHTITAQYTGDTNFQSNSNALTHTVGKGNSSTALQVVTTGSGVVQLVVDVTGVSPATSPPFAAPNGTVTVTISGVSGSQSLTL